MERCGWLQFYSSHSLNVIVISIAMYIYIALLLKVVWGDRVNGIEVGELRSRDSCCGEESESVCQERESGWVGVLQKKDGLQFHG